MGQEAKILLRPRLLINGRKAGIDKLQQCKATVTIYDFDDLKTKIEFDQLKFSEDGEKIV